MSEIAMPGFKNGGKIGKMGEDDEKNDGGEVWNIKIMCIFAR